MQVLLAQANYALGRLDGAVLTLPNPDLFVFMYVRKEAVLSSQIEGTQSSLQNLLVKGGVRGTHWAAEKTGRFKLCQGARNWRVGAGWRVALQGHTQRPTRSLPGFLSRGCL